LIGSPAFFLTANTIKFSIIVVCFFVAAGSYFFCNSKKDWAYLMAAMGFTLLADYFLVIAFNYRVGVFIFCFAHIAYILRVSDNKKKSLQWIISPFVFGWLYYYLFGTWMSQLQTLAFIYAILFAVNLGTHIKRYRYINNRRLILTGLILFVLCDIHVLMFNLPHHLPMIPTAVSDWGRTWIWVFYAPSQILLCLSAVKWKA